MRAGHAEREAVAAELREHYASGRLTLDELNERLDKTFAAKTRGDLDELMRDLPAGHSAQAGGPSDAPGGWGGIGGPGGTGGPGSIGGPGGSGPGDGGPGDWNRQSDWGARTGRGAGQAIAAVIPGLFLIAAMLIVGGLAVFGVGAGRPFGIVLIIAAFAFLRRLFFRRFGRAFGPRRRW
jgi:hypothetical protein